jgi:hypothetical protein
MGVTFLKTPTNGKTAMNEVKALWENGIRELLTHET